MVHNQRVHDVVGTGNSGSALSDLQLGANEQHYGGQSNSVGSGSQDHSNHGKHNVHSCSGTGA